MKRFQVCGLGNGIVDIVVEVSEEEFSSFGVERSSMRLVDLQEQEKLLTGLRHRTPRLVSGGSVGNSVIAISQLGGTSAFITSLGDDRYGLFYQEEAASLGVEIGTALKFRQPTGTCVALITPDAERTMCTCLGAAALLSPEDVSESVIRDSEWLFIEGYVFANPERGPQSIFQALKYAEKHDTKVAVTVSEDFIATVFSEPLKRALAQSSLVFCNEREACALSGAASGREAFPILAKQYSGLVITRGPDGALVSFDGALFSVPAFACEPLDLLGAGDMFAAGFLYGITNRVPTPKAARAACYLAMQVVTRTGARIQTGLKDFWKEGLNAATMDERLSAAR